MQRGSVRTCLGCGARDEQSALLRLVAEDGALRLDRYGKGRGGYLHESEKCWEGFLRKKSVYRAFHLEVGREAREKLIENLRKGVRE